MHEYQAVHNVEDREVEEVGDTDPVGLALEQNG